MTTLDAPARPVGDVEAAILFALLEEPDLPCGGYLPCDNPAAWSLRCEQCAIVSLFCTPCKIRILAAQNALTLLGRNVECTRCHHIYPAPVPFLPL